MEYRFADRLAWLAAGAVFLGIIILNDANASPLPGDERQCAHLSRYALVARSLAEAKVDKQAARGILKKMYTTDDEGSRLASLVLDYAYRETSYAGVFATQFENACLANRQNTSMPDRPAQRLRFKPLVM